MVKLTTAEGLGNLEQKLEELESYARKIGFEIGEAQQESETFHDNAELEDAQIRLRGADKRVSEMHHLISECIIKEYPTIISIPVASYGTNVKARLNDEIIEYQIVGYGHNDPERNTILYESPLAKILIGLGVGHTFSKYKTVIDEEKTFILCIEHPSVHSSKNLKQQIDEYENSSDSMKYDNNYFEHLASIRNLEILDISLIQ